jgi:lysophospholipase L1-like esterase
VPGPTGVGLSRSIAVRGAIAGFVVIALIAAVGAVLRGDPESATVSAGVLAREATLRMVPPAGRTGAATCTDPIARQEWRVTWRTIQAVAPSPTGDPPRPDIASDSIAHAAGAAVPLGQATTNGSPLPGTALTPGTSAPAPPAASSATPTPGPSATADLAAELTERASAVTLVPTGFAVRPLPATAPTPGQTSAARNAAALRRVAAKHSARNAALPGSAVGSTTAASPGPTLPGGWQSRDADRWLLRWSPTLAETVSAAPNEEWVRMGPLTTLAAIAMTVRQNPRFVTPDGACSVYLAPFVSGTAGTRNTVAVIGDSLVAQLYASEDGTATGAGWLMNRLVRAGDRAEIVGQGGRRWTIKPNSGSDLEAADASMLDEIRGVRSADALIIALGTNDAGWVALSSSQSEYELRMAWVLLRLAPILDELRDHTHCTVLTTMATQNKTYIRTTPGRFDAAATRINDYLRERADADPNDRLRLWDWAASANQHGTENPQPWFGADTIHLNQSGRAAYADSLAAAARLC